MGELRRVPTLQAVTVAALQPAAAGTAVATWPAAVAAVLVPRLAAPVRCSTVRAQCLAEAWLKCLLLRECFHLTLPTAVTCTWKSCRHSPTSLSLGCL